MMKKVIAAALVTAAVGSQADAAVFNGFAAGVNAGVLFAKNKTSHNITGIQKIKDANKTLGLFGIQFDYEMSKANSLYARLGLLVSIPTGKSTSTTKNNGLPIKLSIKDTVATEFDAALGYNFCNDVVAYGLAGLSLTTRKVHVNVNHGAFKGGKSKTQLAPVLGAGMMKKVTDKISAGIEYKHTFESSIKDKASSTTKVKIKSSSDSVLARVSYHF